MARYDIIAGPDEQGLYTIIMRELSLLEALRIGLLLWLDPMRYGMFIKARREWVERHCKPVTAGSVFNAPLGK
jgi:hypothetical protein